MSFNVGEMVGPYRIVAQLGQGGMATVYKAYHPALDRYVALKVLHPAFNEDPNFLARFQREARLVAKLDHPNIVPIFDYAEHEGRPYLVMKFIEGKTLKALLAEGPIDANEILRIVEAMGDALQFAHKRGILHRDVKPSNVLLADDGNIYLADFGLARIAQAGESTLTSDMIVGTPQYISPEQALGKKDLDEGTDIYSFGVMLYELIVGKVPFSADTPFSIIHDHIYTPLPMPRVVNPSVSEDVERVLLKSLAKERPDRYKDVHLMVDAFKHAWEISPPIVPIEPSQIVDQQSSLPTRITDTAQKPLQMSSPPAPVVIPERSNDLNENRITEGRSSESLEPSKRKKKPWMWIAAASLAIICCVVGVFALRSLPSSQIKGTPIALPSTLEPAYTPSLSDVDRAQQTVDQKPDDPYARMQLVYALLGTNDSERAALEFDKAIILGGENTQFFLDAGAQLAADQSWLLAARVYLRAAELQKADTIPDTTSVALHESVYKAFILPEARQMIPYESIGNVDKSLMYIAKARYSFYNVDMTQGWTGLADLDTFKPNMPESALLHGEFYARSNEPREARAALETLMARSDLPEWIKIEAQNLIESLPK